MWENERIHGNKKSEITTNTDIPTNLIGEVQSQMKFR